MTLEDALCLVCLTELKEDRLREKLSGLETPTLPAFAVLIDTFMHSKATAGQQNKGGNRNKTKTITTVEMDQARVILRKRDTLL